MPLPLPSLKEKLLTALDITFDDLDTGRLVDLLLDAYAAKERRITELESANAREHEELARQIEMVQQDHHRMRSDPLYCARGEYYFLLDKRRFCVWVQGNKIEMFERRSDIDFSAVSLPPREWAEAKSP